MTQSLPAIISKMEGEIAKALPANVPSKRFVRIAQSAINGNPQIANLERTSVLASIMKAAEMGLVVDGKESAIVPFKGKATFIPMVAGLVKKMRQHSDFASIEHGIVYENEVEQGRFVYEKGDSSRLDHRPIVFGERGAAVGAYAVLTTKDGDKFRVVMHKDDIEKRLAVGMDSQQKRQWREEFWIKTVLRQLYKIAPNSGDESGVLDGVFADDDAPAPIVAQPDPVPHDDDGVIAEPEPEPAPKRTRAAAAVAAAVEDAEVIPADDDHLPM